LIDRVEVSVQSEECLRSQVLRDFLSSHDAQSEAKHRLNVVPVGFLERSHLYTDKGGGLEDFAVTV
jgi:hypothetical protein